MPAPPHRQIGSRVGVTFLTREDTASIRLDDDKLVELPAFHAIGLDPEEPIFIPPDIGSTALRTVIPGVEVKLLDDSRLTDRDRALPVVIELQAAHEVQIRQLQPLIKQVADASRDLVFVLGRR